MSGSGSTGGGDSAETLLGKLVGVLIAGFVIVYVVVWLIQNIVIPVAVLSASVVFALMAWNSKERKALFSVLAIVSAAYMLLDISQGWSSANLVRNVVGSPSWLALFVYASAAAVGCSVWLLASPLRDTAAKLVESDVRRARLYSAGAASLVLMGVVLPPVTFHLAPNPFTQVGVIGQSAVTPGNAAALPAGGQAAAQPSTAIVPPLLADPNRPIEISVFNGWPKEISGCSAGLSSSVDDYDNRRFVYVDDLGAEIAVLAVDGSAVKLRFVKYGSGSPPAREYSNGEYETSVETKDESSIGSEVQRVKGQLTVKRGKQTRVLTLYGIQGC